MKIEIKCDCCGNPFLKEKGEIVRQQKRGRNKFYCSKICIKHGTSDTRTVHENIIRNCLNCEKEFTSTTHVKHRTCCSQKCASSYSRSFANPENISNGMKLAHKEGRAHKTTSFDVDNACEICGASFKSKDWNKRKTCSKECKSKLISKNSSENPNCGGETNYKKYSYNGITMDSSWEVKLAEWMDKNAVNWERDRKKHVFKWNDVNGKSHRYYPDFYLPEKTVYVDTKNKFLMIQDSDKLDRVRKQRGISLYAGTVDEIISLINGS